MSHYDVVILGGGLAGQTLARHLLLETDRTVLLLDRLEELPMKRQKVGESTVQLAGYYLSRVLDLEEHLLRRHLMKYNLRFYWKSAGRANDAFEDYSQGYIREISNIASYQVDRNALEAELLRLNGADPRFTAALGATAIDVDLRPGDELHRLAYDAGGERHQATAGWVVDATGRGRLLAKRRGLRRPNTIHHGAYFWWVDGLVDVERLTGRSRREVRADRRRSTLGHLPMWLATNHFCAEGLWFWVIPLHGKTSLGLVFDRRVLDLSDVNSPEKATEWVCRMFPLFARDLPQRRVLDGWGYRDFSHDCAQTIHPDRWALSGEAGRFSDPLYSPGSDLIAVYNTLIVDAIGTADGAELVAKTRMYETMMRAVYSAYVPSYELSYDALGDPETFSLKYTWELAVYFGFYVFPFINDLLTQRRFTPSWLRAFSRLGPINQGVQRLLSGYFQWRKERIGLPAEPVDFDFTELTPLDRARDCFYEVGVSIERARRVLSEQLDNLEELARFTAARVAAVVLGDPRVMTDRAFLTGIDPARLDFDPAAMRRRWQDSPKDGEPYRWRLDPTVLDRFPAVAAPSPPAAGSAPEPLEAVR